MIIVKTFLPLVLAMAVFACNPQKQVYYEANASEPAATSAATNRKEKPDNIVYYVFEQGNYVQSELDKKPRPIGGEDSFSRAMASHMDYPTAARERGVAGTVILTVTLNEAGRAEEVQVKKGIGYGCDEVALNAWKKAAQNGFEPAVKSGKTVKVRYEVSVDFKVR